LITLVELADAIGAKLKGDAGFQVAGIASPKDATSQQITFVARSEFLSSLADTQAGAVITTEQFNEQSSYNGHVLLADDPYLAYAKASRLFDANFADKAATIHPSACIAEGVSLGANVSIGANAVIESGCCIGDNALIGPGSFIGANSVVGQSTRIYANVSVYHSIEIGEHCIIHSGTVIGCDGFGFAPSSEGWVKIHQLGRVIIGNKVEIGGNCSIDRGALGDTVIADGVIIDNLVHMAHNVKIGRNTAIAGCCGFAGSTTVGENCTFAGQVGVNGHIEITDGAHFLGKAMVTNSVTEPGVYASGIPLSPVKKWRKNAVRFSQLDELARMINRLAKKLND